MLNTPLIKRLGLTPAKLILIGVLAIVLVIVVVIQLPSGSSAPVASEAPIVDSVETPVTSPVDERSTEPAAQAKRQVDWPTLALNEVVRHDPFQLPAHLRPARPQESEPNNPQDRQHLQTLTNAESGMVLMVGDEHVARIGATTLRTGDKIGSYRVSKIDATGVWLVDEQEESE